VISMRKSNEVYCMKCGKRVCSHDLPEDAVIRAWIECPECSTMSAPFCPVLDRCCVGQNCPAYSPDKEPYTVRSLLSDGELVVKLKRLFRIKPYVREYYILRRSFCKLMGVYLTTKEEYLSRYDCEGYDCVFDD